MNYVITAHYGSGDEDYSARGEEAALEAMDLLHEGGIAYDTVDGDGRSVDENDLTDRIGSRGKAAP